MPSTSTTAPSVNMNPAGLTSQSEAPLILDVIDPLIDDDPPVTRLTILIMLVGPEKFACSPESILNRSKL